MILNKFLLLNLLIVNLYCQDAKTEQKSKIQALRILASRALTSKISPELARNMLLKCPPDLFTEVLDNLVNLNFDHQISGLPAPISKFVKISDDSKKIVAILKEYSAGGEIFDIGALMLEDGSTHIIDGTFSEMTTDGPINRIALVESKFVRNERIQQEYLEARASQAAYQIPPHSVINKNLLVLDGNGKEIKKIKGRFKSINMSENGTTLVAVKYDPENHVSNKISIFDCDGNILAKVDNETNARNFDALKVSGNGQVIVFSTSDCTGTYAVRNPIKIYNRSGQLIFELKETCVVSGTTINYNGIVLTLCSNPPSDFIDIDFESDNPYKDKLKIIDTQCNIETLKHSDMELESNDDGSYFIARYQADKGQSEKYLWTPTIHNLDKQTEIEIPALSDECVYKLTNGKIIFKNNSDYRNTKLRVVDINSGKTELTLPANFNIIAVNKAESMFLIEHNGKYFIYKNQNVLQEAIKSIMESKDSKDIEYLKQLMAFIPFQKFL